MSIVKTGTTTLGLVYKDGVVLAADRRATADHIVANKNAEKVMAISNRIGITTAGMVADLQAMVRLMRSELTLYEIRSGSKLDTDGAVSLLSAILFNKRLSLNLIYGEFIIGGYDGEPKLFSIDEAGGQGKDKFTVTGSGGIFALGVLEGDYKDNMTEEEAIKLAYKAISSSIRRDVYTGEGIDIAVINKKGYNKLSDEEIQKVINK
ncbi:proteasome subunit beta [Candidatus Parvarchaeota archaeon]|jgi:proteasome beta subunit|nr:proteasome subunit beta [Candidatus Parvarchaeota archaeon]